MVLATSASLKLPGLLVVTRQVLSCPGASGLALLSDCAIAKPPPQMIDGLGFEIVTVTPASARRIAEAYGNWGKGIHPAALNFGDCFAYEVTKEHGCPLLYVGKDFARTDIESVL